MLKAKEALASIAREHEDERRRGQGKAKEKEAETRRNDLLLEWICSGNDPFLSIRIERGCFFGL